MRAPRISAIVPAYNRAVLLAETLNAVIAQSLQPYEIIVVHDGSVDGTADMLKRRYGGLVSPLRIANSGDLVARNAGLRAATGDLVAFCDSGDLWRPGFLLAMADLWAAEPRTRVAFSDFVVLRDGVPDAARNFDSAPLGTWSGLRPVGPDLAVFDMPIVNRLIQFQPFFPSCMAADRLFLLDMGGWNASTGRFVGTDIATIVPLGEHAPFGVVQRPLVNIRKDSSNRASDAGAMSRGHTEILEHVLARRLSPAARVPRGDDLQQRRLAPAKALDLAFARGSKEEGGRIYAGFRPNYHRWKQRIQALAAVLPTSPRDATGLVSLAVGMLGAPLLEHGKPALGRA